jgi:cytochrome P450
MLLLATETDRDSAGGMTDRQVRDELMTLFLAGHETTANALAWTWYLLAQHPDIYARMQAETDAAMASDPDRLPDHADLDRMPYTLQVFKEAMRLYPPAYAIARQALVPTQIAGYRVPRGAVVLISPYMLHRRPDAFPDPERFDPDRWTPERERTRPRYSYLPFGGGPRICIGAAFALMEGHLCLAAIARRVTFTLAYPQRPVQTEPLITLRPRGPIALRVHRRAPQTGTSRPAAPVSLAGS